MKLYSYFLSGNSFKVRFLLSVLKLDYELIETCTTAPKDKEAGTNKPDFLKINPKGEVPVLIDGDKKIIDSAAICCYLALKYDGRREWFPRDEFVQSRIIYWITTSAKEINSSLAKARRRVLYNDTRFDLKQCQISGYKILDIIEQALQESLWLATNDHPTLADVVCYPYIALCHQGNMSLENYPRILDWIKRFQNIEGYIHMDGMLEV